MLDQSIILIYVVYTCTGNMLFLLLVELYLSYILCIYLLCICISIYLAVVLQYCTVDIVPVAVFLFTFIMVILKSYIQLYFIWVYLFVFVELGSFCHTCRFIVNLTLNRAMDLSGGAPLLLDTFMLRWSTLIGYLHAGPIYYSYIRSIYLYWKHAIPVACRAVPFLYTLYILAVYIAVVLQYCTVDIVPVAVYLQSWVVSVTLVDLSSIFL